MTQRTGEKKITYNRSYSGYMFWSLYVLCSVILLSLGTWQVMRHIEKKDASDYVSERLVMPPIPIAEGLNLGKNGYYRRVEFDATLRHEQTLYLFTGPFVINGRPGYDVITPADITGTDKTIAVNRGWIDEAYYKAGGVIAPEAESGSVSFYAVLTPGEKQGFFTPDNDDKNNIWFWVDLNEIAARSNVDPLHVYATLTDVPDVLKTQKAPIPREIKPRKHLPHAGYAVTWYSFFLILTVIVYTLRSQTLKKEKLPTSGHDTATF